MVLEKDIWNLISIDGNIMAELRQNDICPGLTGADEVKRALNNPTASEKLSEIVKPGEKTVIITSDITRPMPSKIVLPEVIDELLAAGLEYKDITVVFALGNHRKQTEEEKKYLVGESVYEKVNCIDSVIRMIASIWASHKEGRQSIFSVW